MTIRFPNMNEDYDEWNNRKQAEHDDMLDGIEREEQPMSFGHSLMMSHEDFDRWTEEATEDEIEAYNREAQATVNTSRLDARIFEHDMRIFVDLYAQATSRPIDYGERSLEAFVLADIDERYGSNTEE